MPPIRYEKEVETDYEDYTLPDLEVAINDAYRNLVLQINFRKDIEVHDLMWKYLALLRLEAKRKREDPRDKWQAKAAGDLFDAYDALFRNPDATSQHIFTYAVDQTEFFASLGYDDLQARWQQIAEAYARAGWLNVAQNK